MKGESQKDKDKEMVEAYLRYFFIDPRANECISYKAGQGFPLSGS